MAKTRRKPARHGHGKGGAGQGGGKVYAPEWLVMALAGVGMAITAWLVMAGWLDGSAAFCAEGGGCDLIQQSRWSTVLGLPVALWGLLLYTLMLLLAWRMPPTLKRWRRLIFLALLGVTISIYLTVAGAVGLGAFCPWCLLSLLIISALLIALLLRRPESAPGMPWSQWGAQSLVVVVVAAGLLHLQYSDLLTPRGSPELQALATHLDERGAKYYGAYWCPSCQEQKRLFRSAADDLPFVECSPGGQGSPMTTRCQDLGIDTYPTWIINGRRYTGVQSPEDLARYSRFRWSE